MVFIGDLGFVAKNYSDYRPRYPQRLIDDLREHTVGDHGDCFIDWGCGTGELTLPLCHSSNG
jgi:ubiquinone/menaquinone biosynthesis C-methylase UbiE